MAQYWFKGKSFGWGFGMPLNSQGWIALSILMILIIMSAYTNNMFESNHSVKDIFRNILDISVLAFLFVYVVQDKVEGGVKWR